MDLGAISQGGHSNVEYPMLACGLQDLLKVQPMSFQIERRIRFADVDPAGIVFYPRYFEMVNEIVEDWFDRKLKSNFHEITQVQKHGVPLAHVEIDFVSPSKLYEQITLTLAVQKLGTSSVTLNVAATHKDQVRFNGTLILVHIDLGSGSSLPWPEALRSKMLADSQGPEL